MKLKAGIRYQAVELVQSAAAFCLIVGAIIVAFNLLSFTKISQMTLPSLGFLPYILMPLLALATFSDGVRFLMRMGLTRSQTIASTVASLGAVCLFLAVVEAACAALVPFWPFAQSLFLMTYGPQNGPLLDFLFTFLGCAATAALGLAFAALQMRFGTRRVVLVTIAVLVIAASQLSPWAIADGWTWLFALAPGASLANPFALFVVVIALGLLAAWAASRRYEVR
ncbi:hypothetical protein [Gordonibacter massiliensis (ex Traore et al. 2017)]|uniref:Uncharacterized protein n=1 Tax=Gordonibacter massiliensis (ex Traore et al. 2017) TaxID=1841863 RepID=A0A842JGA7_9ACTN|nr:hypothetical protein [Gordonibacter massiliensis (ex Traore et al. 2017)]MBC2890454.1 hypothetical protein [Gordonibacter massiliensis (ex Traore et al. 2017)]